MAGKNDEGFTILEVLLAAAMGAVILSVLYWSYTTVLGTTSRYREDSDFYQTVRITLGNMGREISGAFSPLFAGEELMFLGKDGWFKGMEADELSFVTTTCLRGEEEEAGYDTFEISYYLGSGEEEGLLLMRRSPYFNLEDPFSEGEELILAENVRALNFEYFDGTDWLEEWDPEDQTTLPRAVRIGIALGGEKDKDPQRFTTAAWLPLAGKWAEQTETG